MNILFLFFQIDTSQLIPSEAEKIRQKMSISMIMCYD